MCPHQKDCARGLKTYRHPQRDPGIDIGSRRFLQKYERRRHLENRMVMSVMTGFNTVFSNDTYVLSKLRNRGLMLADTVRPAKNYLLRRAMWMSLNPSRN